MKDSVTKLSIGVVVSASVVFNTKLVVFRKSQPSVESGFGGYLKSPNISKYLAGKTRAESKIRPPIPP